MVVTDESKDSFDSGMKSVTWSVDDGIAADFISTVANEGISVDNKYAIAINANGNNETNDVALTVIVEDAVGNKYTYVHEFAVDNLDPRIAYTFNGKNTIDAYYNEPVNVQVQIEDLNMEATYDSKNGVWDCPGLGIAVTNHTELGSVDDVTGSVVYVPNTYIPEVQVKHSENTIVYSYDLTFSEGDQYSILAEAKDRAANEAANDTGIFTVDTTAPVIEVIKTVEGDQNPINVTESGVAYYNGKVTFTVNITDENLSSGSAYANLYYEYENGENKTLALDDGWVISNNPDGTVTYSHDIVVEDGEVLTNIAVQAMDNAANAAATIKQGGDEDTNFVYLDAPSNVHVFGEMIAVDSTVPVITVTKTVDEAGSYKQSFQNVDYYDAPVTYEIEVTDRFLDKTTGELQVTVINQDGSTTDVDMNCEGAEGSNSLLADNDVWSGSFTINNGELIQGIELKVVDNAGNSGNGVDNEGNPIDKLTEVDADNKVADPENNVEERILTVFAFDETEKVWNYTGNPVVCDMTKPVVEWKFSENVKSFFYNAKLNTLYAILENVVEGESGKPVNAKNETVTVTLTAADKNLTIEDKTLDEDEQSKYCVKTAEGDWNGETSVNTDSTVTYEITSEKVGADGIATFVLDVNVVDLAGNTFAAFEIVEEYTTEEGNEITNIWPVASSEDGKIAFNITVDRQRPSSDTVDADTSAPTIEIKPSIEPTKTKNAAGQEIDLFDKDFSFDLKVTDGKEDILNSGIKSVKWNVVDANEIVADPDGGATYEEAFFEGNYKIEVNQANAAGESNEIFVEITAEDQAGNIIKFKKLFGFDTLAPRVTITPSNTSYQNEKYYKADQTISVEITDLNFTSDLAYTRHCCNYYS